MLFGLEWNLATVLLAALIVFLAYRAVRRIHRNGLCDCHKGENGCAGCSSGSCAGCSGCAAAGHLASDPGKAPRARRRRA